MTVSAPLSPLVLPLQRMSADKILQTLPHGLMAMLEVLREGERLQVVLRHDDETATRPVLEMHVATPPDTSPGRSRRLAEHLLQFLRIHFPLVTARPVATETAQRRRPENSLLIVPERPMDWTRQPVGPQPVRKDGAVAETDVPGLAGLHHLKTQLTLQEPAHLLLALRTLNQLPGKVRLVFEMASCRLEAAEISRLQTWLRSIEQDPGAMLRNQQVEHEVRAMLESGRGYRLACRLESDAPVDLIAADHVSLTFYGSRHDTQAGCATLPTWSSSVMVLRGLVPLCGAIMLWADYGRRPLAPAADAICLGRDLDGQSLYLKLRDRARHTYIIGITGTGKSTLMLNMALQDMEAGRCVILLDPHGDLWEQMRRIVPPERRDDVLLCHLADPRWQFTINVLAGVHGQTERDANMIVSSLYDLFKRLVYKDVKEAFGPVFETLFRNALMLLIMANHPDLTLADLERVFVDRKFRDWLLERVDDPHQYDFWKKVFPGLGGDWNQENLTLYVTSKFSMILQNPLLKPILTSPVGTLSFMDVMKERRICLINLAKGQVGARDASFVAGLLTLRLAMAAMAQSRKPDGERHAACVYMDEFHNYASYILGDMLAETRKYGLHITLAHQTLGQINDQRAIDDLRHDVLANTANKLIFRVGRMDAEALEHFVSPHFNARSLSALDDHMMVAVTLDDGRTREPALIRTPPPPPLQDVKDPPMPDPLPQRPRPDPDAPVPPRNDPDDEGDNVFDLGAFLKSLPGDDS